MIRSVPCLLSSLVVTALAACGSGEPPPGANDGVSAPPPADAAGIVRPSDRPADDESTPGEAPDAPVTDEPGSGPTEDPAPNPGDEPGTPPAGGGETDVPQGGGDGPSTPPLITARSSSAESLLYTLVWREPGAIGNGFAHDHVVRATDWAGTLQFRVGDAGACAVDIDVVTAALLNDEPVMRAEVGLDGTLSDSDRETVRGHMLGEGQLEADTFPTISFTSTTCRGDVDGAGTLEVEGALTIRDVTQTVTWTVDYEVEADGRLFAQGNLTVAQTDFGITPYSAFFGAVRVADDVDLAFDLVGAPTGP
jgi:polyisoprenoid-binding protein YceI